MSAKFLIASAGLLAALSAQATVSVTSAAFTYNQSFDSLASSGTSSAWANDSTLAGWSLFFTNIAPLTGFSSPSTYLVGTGSATNGGFYSFGAAGSGERALGGIAINGNVTPGTSEYITAAFKNDSGTALDSFTLRYDGEQWRNNGNTSAQSLTVQYGFGATFASVTTWTSAGAGFTFTSPVNSSSAAAVVGNTVGKVANLGGTVALNWAAGDTLWVRWNDVNDANNDHALAIDNVSFGVTAAPVPEPGTYAMLLAGLGAVGFIARRRRG